MLATSYHQLGYVQGLRHRGGEATLASFEKAMALTRERIAKLVRYHGLPLRFTDNPDPARALVLASLEVNLRDGTRRDLPVQILSGQVTDLSVRPDDL